MIVVVRYNIPTVIYELYGKSRITTGILYSIFGLRVPDDGTVTFYREVKLKMGFGVVVHCCLKKNQNAPRPSEHPPVWRKKCQNV